MTRTSLLLGLLITWSLYSSALATPKALETYLAAIDVPLTPHGITMMAAQPHDLIHICLDENRSLYQRGRALSAFAMVAGHNGPDTLRLIAGSSLPTPLRLQAIISLTRIYGRSDRSQTMAYLIEVLPGPPRWMATVEELLSELEGHR